MFFGSKFEVMGHATLVMRRHKVHVMAAFAGDRFEVLRILAFMDKRFNLVEPLAFMGER